MNRSGTCGTCEKPIKDCTCLKNGGAKDDGGKPRWDLLPIAEVEEIVQILTDGARKYKPDNWQKVPEGRTRYYAAMMRHIVAWWKGEKTDPDSGKSHLAHAGCCLLFLMWLDRNKGGK